MCGINRWADSVPPSAVAIPPPPATRGWGSPATSVEVVRVGRKWFETSDRREWSLENWSLKSDYSGPRLWNSEQECLDDIAHDARWRDLRRAIAAARRSALTIQQVETILDWLKEEDRDANI
jgi:hypothetical protein